MGILSILISCVFILHVDVLSDLTYFNCKTAQMFYYGLIASVMVLKLCGEI